MQLAGSCPQNQAGPCRSAAGVGQAEPMDTAALTWPPGWCDPVLGLDEAGPPPAPVPRAAQLAASAVVRMLAETLMGHRNPEQLGRWLDPLTIIRVTAFGQCLRDVRIRPQRCRLSSPLPGRVEAVFVLDCGTRCLAVVLSLAETDGRWTCRDLSLLLPEGAARQSQHSQPQVRRRSGSVRGTS